jgi:hypothetical protein
MRTKLDWLFNVTRKQVFFIALMILCGAWLGVLCSAVAHQYEQLFFPFSQALKSAAWVIGSLLLISILISLASALLHPLKLLLFAHALGALAFLLVWRTGWISLIGALIYFFGLTYYSDVLVSELEKRLEFSLRPLSYEQRKIFMIMALLLSISFTWGYRQSITPDSLKVPQNFRTAAEDMILSGLKSQVKNQPDLEPAEREIYLEQARKSLASSWDKIEGSVQPYARFIPISLLLPFYFLLMGILDTFSWVPYLLLWMILSLFQKLGITQTVAETKERQRLKL